MGLITDPSLLDNQHVTVLDVRPILERGEEPFATIRQHLEELDEEATLLLVAPFDPHPLKKYVTEQGFKFQYWEPRDEMTWTAIHGGDREARSNVDGPGPSVVVPIPGGSIYVLDCRDLSPPRPLEWTTELLAGLEERDVLVQHNDRYPALLLENLDRFDWDVTEEDDRYMVEFKPT